MLAKLSFSLLSALSTLTVSILCYTNVLHYYYQAHNYATITQHYIYIY